MKFSFDDFFSDCDLVTLTEEIRNKKFIFRPWHVNELLAFDIKNLLLLEKLQFYVCGFSKFLEQETRNQQQSPTAVIASQLANRKLWNYRY